MSQSLQHVGRALRIHTPPPATAPQADTPQKLVRIDGLHDQAPPPHFTPSTKRTPRAAGGETNWPGLLAWGALLLGTMLFACGGTLAGWSVVAGRDELWTLGLPILLGGVIGLLVGFILQFDRLGRESQSIADRLEEVNAQLGRIHGRPGLRVDPPRCTPEPPVHLERATEPDPQRDS